GHLQGQVLVAGVRDPPPGARPGREAALHLGPEPFAELGGVGQGAPDPGPGRLHHDLLLDAVRTGGSGHEQPPGCILGRPSAECNPGVAYRPQRDGGASPAGIWRVPSTTRRKVRSSRRMSFLSWAAPKLARASGSAFKRAR